MLRTPDERFADLRDFPFAPHYLEVTSGDGATARMHYVDEGPRGGTPIVLLHGEPTWSYLYRTMIPPLVAAGHRVLAPDLIGFGKSDKPTRAEDHSYQRHVDWVGSWLDQLALTEITPFLQDWGSLIGLRIVGEQPDRFARLVVGNGFLPTAHRPPNLAFRAWRSVALHTPVFRCGLIVQAGTVRAVPRHARAAYDAPYPGPDFQAGARCFPRLVPTSPDDPAVSGNQAAWESLGRFEKPFLALFGRLDPILGRADGALIRHIPGGRGQPHARLRAGHFVQEDAGPELADRMLAWMG